MATYNVLAYDSTNNLPVLPSSSDTVNIQGDATIAGDTILTGNLTVNGTTTTVNSEIATADDQIHLNSAYTNTSAPKDAGLIFTVEPLGVAYSISEFGGGVNKDNMTLATAVSNWSAGDIIQISGCSFAENNGLYELEGQDTSTRFFFKALAQGDSISASLVDICQLADFTQGSVTAGTAVEVKVMQFKTDEANNQFVYKYGSTASNMSADQTFGGSIAADDITAGDAAVEITTTTGDIAIDSPTGQAVRLQINGDDKLVCDGDNVQVKAGKNLLIEDSAAIATQLLFAGSSTVSAFDALYINTSGELARADSDGGSLHYNLVGSALEAGPSGAAAVKAAMTTSGQVAGFTFTGGNPSTGDRGSRVYLSTTAGQVSLTAPSASGDHVVVVGFVYSATALATNVYPVLFQPQYINQIA
jgi:hypothetical protein